MNDPGAAAAHARVQAVLERLRRVEVQVVVVVAAPDSTRLDARSRARDAAITAGRGALLDQATMAARDVAIRAFAGSAFTGTWAATEMAASVASAGDRVAAAAAFEEAATAAVVEDLVDSDVLDVLRSTADVLMVSTALPSPGSLSGFTAPSAVAPRGPVQIAIIAAVVIACAAIALVVGLAAGLLVLAVAVAVVAGLARRRPRPDP